jgi:heptosyltransferase III
MKLRGRPTLRFLDRYVGIPVISLFGLKPKRSMPTRIERIGVLRTAAIGEVLLISGILSDLRVAFPDADLTMVTGEENAMMGELVSRGRCRHIAVSIHKPLSAARALRRERFDVLIDTGPWPRLDAILTAMAGARFTIGFSSRDHYRHYAYDLVVPHGRDVHEIENFRSLVRPLGAMAASLPSLNVGGTIPAEISQGTYVVFHPWSGGFRAHLREWPTERWVRVAEGLRGIGATFLISGSPADAPRSQRIADAIAAHGLRAQSIAGQSVEAMIPILRQAALVVGVNTSITHLASIVGATTVMLEGPTSPRRWGLLGPHSVSVCSEFPGCGFVHHGFEFEGQREDCMLGVFPEAVIHAAHDRLAARRTPASAPA